MRRRLLLLLLVLLLLGVLIPVGVTLLGPTDPTLPDGPESRPDPDLPSGPPAARNAAGEPIPLTDTTAGTESGSESQAVGEGPGEEAARSGEASGRGSAASGGTAGAGEAAAKVKGSPGWFPKLEGTVVDVRTGKPVVGARLHYGSPSRGSWGDDADKEGGFDFSVPQGRDPEEPFRLRVMATGYETLDFVPREGSLVVELIPRAGPAMSGSIRGRAEDKDGRPVRGIVTVALGDETVMRHWLAVKTDERGAFLLEAVEPGARRIRLGSGDTVNVWVPEDGEAEVALRSRQSRETLEARTFTAEEAKQLEELNAEFRRAYAEAEMLERRGAPADELRRAEDRRDLLHGRVQKLDRERRNAVSRRPARVTGVPGRDGSRLVAEWHGGASIERWWAVVRNGLAEFPALFAGTWHIMLKSEDGEKSGRVEIRADRDVAFPTEAEPK